MLAWETESIRADTTLLKDLALRMVTDERSVDGKEGIFPDDFAAYKVAEIEEGAERTQHLRGNMALNGWEVNLERCEIGKGLLEYLRTFMRAFESSPVHCLKPGPSGKRRSPGNGGTAAMLFR
jgi:hypothetical protein